MGGHSRFGGRQQPIDALADLADGLVPHLDEEEATILPLCAQHLSRDEWAQMPGHAAARFNGDKPWLILGLIQENMTPAERQAMLQHMPPQAQQMWMDAGASAFEDFVVELRGPLAPAVPLCDAS